MSSSSSDDEVFQYQHRPRQYRDRINFNLGDFVQRFRLQRHQVDLLENTIGGFLQHGTQRNHALSP